MNNEPHSTPPSVPGASSSRLINVAGASSSKLDLEQDAQATPKRKIAIDWASLQIKHGTYLPHWSCDNAIYHISFRLSDAIPQAKCRQWIRERQNILETAKDMNRDLSEHERQRINHLYSDTIETYLDASHGECLLRKPALSEIVKNALIHFDGKRYNLHAWCVMPNHVHAITEPINDHAVCDIIHSWKSFTAKKCNAFLGRKGQFWQHESYDHIIRSQKEFLFQLDYVWNNPTKANISALRWRIDEPVT